MFYLWLCVVFVIAVDDCKGTIQFCRIVLSAVIVLPRLLSIFRGRCIFFTLLLVLFSCMHLLLSKTHVDLVEFPNLGGGFVIVTVFILRNYEEVPANTNRDLRNSEF